MAQGGQHFLGTDEDWDGLWMWEQSKTPLMAPLLAGTASWLSLQPLTGASPVSSLTSECLPCTVTRVLLLGHLWWDQS